jgi:hypothetical protein
MLNANRRLNSAGGTGAVHQRLVSAPSGAYPESRRHVIATAAAFACRRRKLNRNPRKIEDNFSAQEPFRFFNVSRADCPPDPAGTYPPSPFRHRLHKPDFNAQGPGLLRDFPNPGVQIPPAAEISPQGQQSHLPVFYQTINKIPPAYFTEIPGKVNQYGLPYSQKLKSPQFLVQAENVPNVPAGVGYAQGILPEGNYRGKAGTGTYFFNQGLMAAVDAVKNPDGYGHGFTPPRDKIFPFCNPHVCRYPASSLKAARFFPDNGNRPVTG